MNPLWTISIHFATQIRKLTKQGLDTTENHLMESLPFVCQLRAKQKYEYWKRHTKKS
jgi:hypothetical protein